MTRLLTTGFETGDIAEAGVSIVTANSTLTVVSSTPTPRAGTYCFKAASTVAALSSEAVYKSFTFPSAKTEIWARFAFFAHFASTQIPLIATLISSGSVAQTAVTYTPSDGLLRLYRGTGTLLGTSTTSFPQDTWHVIEWRTLISTATTGTSEVWLDGTQVINFSGDNSQDTNLNIQSIRLGSNSSTWGASGTYLAFDDIAINDTSGTINNGRPGDGRVILLVPSGAGSSTQFTRGGTDTGANWSQTSELPPSMTQYVLSSTVAQRDLYAMSNLGGAVLSINVVEELVLAQNSDAGAGSIAPTIKSGATTNEATAVSLGTSAGYVTGRWETDPNTTATWTAAAIDALEAGVTVR